MRALGVSIVSGVMHLAALDVAEGGGRVLGHPLAAARRIVPSDGLGEAARVADLRDRFKQDLRSLGVGRVALVETRLFGGWRYKSALGRVTAMSASMIAATELNVPYDVVKTEAISRVVGVPAASLERTPVELFGFDSAPTYWTSGLAEAYGAAAWVLYQGG